MHKVVLVICVLVLMIAGDGLLSAPAATRPADHCFASTRVRAVQGPSGRKRLSSYFLSHLDFTSDSSFFTNSNINKFKKLGFCVS